MTTRLAGEGHRFLPFNQGRDGGSGQPGPPERLRDGLPLGGGLAAGQLARHPRPLRPPGVRGARSSGKKITRRAIIFPRYHQLDAVRKLDGRRAKKKAPGKNYLIQHSAGSGKSNTIAWLAHRLSSLHDENDKQVFDSVIVITDRRVLDQQLQDTIYQFEHKQGVVQKIDENSTQLADGAEAGTPIIITTLQKFPFVLEKIGELPNRRYALIVDEAHGSQTGEAATNLKEVLAATSLETAETEDADEAEDDRRGRDRSRR